MKCQWCKSNDIKFTLTPKSVHYGRNDCQSCGRWCEWIKNPESTRTKNPNRKMKLSVDRICLFHKMSIPICFFCLRKKEQLGWNETLTVDHIQELDKGGEDIMENMQVLCFACHKLKNWARLYMNWHLNSGESNDS